MADGAENIHFEAAPDVEVTFQIMQGDLLVDEIEANINISRTVLELKRSLSKPLGISIENIEIFNGDEQMQDHKQIMDYEIEAEQILILKNLTPTNQ
ncbi:unnamed protein product [Lymnaea stagnalis]|uniref:Ubiquitin-like domain-containing protein n=1 Tax=Lymnaea stagnalis TaxID=6523 RepID=A0AAV2HSX1_LYMST